MSATISPSVHTSSASAWISWRRMRKLQPPTPRTSFRRETTCSPEMKVTSMPPRTSVKVTSNGAESCAYFAAAAEASSSISNICSRGYAPRPLPASIFEGGTNLYLGADGITHRAAERGSQGGYARGRHRAARRDPWPDRHAQGRGAIEADAQSDPGGTDPARRKRA